MEVSRATDSPGDEQTSSSARTASQRRPMAMDRSACTALRRRNPSRARRPAPELDRRILWPADLSASGSRSDTDQLEVCVFDRRGCFGVFSCLPRRRGGRPSSLPLSLPPTPMARAVSSSARLSMDRRNRFAPLYDSLGLELPKTLFGRNLGTSNASSEHERADPDQLVDRLGNQP